MIQRIQSIWLLLATLTLLLMFVFPILTTSEISFYTSGLQKSVTVAEISGTAEQSFLPLVITHIAVALICFINIFNFRKRTSQKRVAIVTIILTIAFAFWCSVYAQKIPGGIEGAHFGIGAYLPALTILFIVLAIFGINKDERLIRSAERLR